MDREILVVLALWPKDPHEEALSTRGPLIRQLKINAIRARDVRRWNPPGRNYGLALA
jgi:hypothetical protein